MDLNSPAHWQQRAEETLRLANQLVDPAAKQALLEIAQSYEQLAIMAATRALGKSTT